MRNYINNKFSKYPELKGYISENTRLEDIFNFKKLSINNEDNKKNVGLII